MKKLILPLLILISTSITKAQLSCSDLLGDANTFISLEYAVLELDQISFDDASESERQTERSELLEELLTDFKPALREILYLKYVEEKTAAEISEIVGIPESRVRARFTEINKRFANIRKFRERRNAEVITQEFIENQINTAQLKYGSKVQALRRILHRHFQTYDVSRDLYGFTSLLIFIAEEQDPNIKNTKDLLNQMIDSIDKTADISGTSVSEVNSSYTELNSQLRRDALNLLKTLFRESHWGLSVADHTKLEDSFRTVFTGHYRASAF